MPSRPDASARRSRSTSSAPRGSPATTGAARASTCPAYAASGLPARRWAAGSPRTRCSSAPRSPAAARSRELAGEASPPRERVVSASSDGGVERRVRGARRRDRLQRRLVDVRIERFRHADGEEVSREIVRHRAPSGSSPTTSSTCGSCASRARRSTSPTCWRSPPGAWTWTARSRCGRPARARRGDRPRRAQLGADRHLLHERRLHRRAGAPVLRQRPATSTARQRRGRAHRDRAVAAGELQRRDRGVPRREDADRPAVARAPAERLIAPPRSARASQRS